MRVPAGTAKPGPAIGQALGPLGINMMEFCKKFNEETKHIVQNTPMPCVSLCALSACCLLVDVSLSFWVWSVFERIPRDPHKAPTALSVPESQQLLLLLLQHEAVMQVEGVLVRSRDDPQGLLVSPPTA